MNNVTSKKTKEKYDWDNNFALLEEKVKKGEWISAYHSTDFGKWIKYLRQKGENCLQRNTKDFNNLDLLEIKVIGNRK